MQTKADFFAYMLLKYSQIGLNEHLASPFGRAESEVHHTQDYKNAKPNWDLKHLKDG